MRTLQTDEIADLLHRDVVARLATVDADGYPHVTPIWFAWQDGIFYLTSHAGRPHLSRIALDARVGLVIDVEAELRADGQRPNKQIRVTGEATLSDDTHAAWTTRIRQKYLGSPPPPRRGESRRRILITVIPRTVTAVASV